MAGETEAGDGCVGGVQGRFVRTCSLVAKRETPREAEGGGEWVKQSRWPKMETSGRLHWLRRSSRSVAHCPLLWRIDGWMDRSLASNVAVSRDTR
jgi:hypothetical protein